MGGRKSQLPQASEISDGARVIFRRRNETRFVASVADVWFSRILRDDELHELRKVGLAVAR